MRMSCCRPLAAEHERLTRLQSTDPNAAVLWLSCSAACGVFQGQSSNRYLLHWQADSLPVNQPGSPSCLNLMVLNVIIWNKGLFMIFNFKKVSNIKTIYNATQKSVLMCMYFPGGARGKEPICQCRRQKELWVRSLGQEDPLEEGMATHSSSLGWRIPWTEKPGGLQSMGS